MADRKNDEYQNVKFYAEHSTAKQSGFSKFKVGEDYYFCRYVDGDIAMLSQAYTGEAGRDNGIESVKKNEKLFKRYKFETRGTKHGFALKAGNGHEIAISPDYTSLSAAEGVSERLTGQARPTKTSAKPAKSKPKAMKKPAAKPKVKKVKSAKTASASAAFTRSDGRIENYRPLSFYQKHGGKADGFNRFEQDGAYYFHYNEGEEIVLISESYTSKSGRDNGIASVQKNIKLKTAYQHHTHKNGKQYFDLNAANRQEIATSRWYDSEAKALQAAAHLRGERTKTRSANVEQNYMPLAFYKKASKGRAEGFEKFQGEDGEHYFSYFENNKIALISEGYPTAAIRDKGLASVEKNMKLENRYVYGKGADGKDGFILRAGNHKEIARSVGYGSAAAAAAGAAYLMGTRRRAPKKPTNAAAATLAAGAVAATPAVAKPKPKPAPKPKPKPKSVAKVSAPKAPVKPALVKKPVAAPVKGAAAAAAAAASLAGASKAAATPPTPPKPKVEPVKPVPVKEPKVVVSAPPPTPAEPKVPVAAPIAAAAAGTAAVAGAMVASSSKVETPKAAPVKAAAVTSAPAAAAAAASGTGGGAGIWGWLKWLLLGLLALLAALFLFKSCAGGDSKVKTSAATTAETASPAAMVTCWNDTKAKSETACPAKITCWDNSFATSEAACPVKPIAKDYVCWDGSNAVDAGDCPVEPATTTTATISPSQTQPKTQAGTTITSAAPKLSVGNATSGPFGDKMTASSIATRICGPSANPLFDVSALTPRNVTYLGSNPQFGDSTGYTSDEFFRRLQVKYRTSPRDKSFLDLLARSLGYEAFANMDASMFSNDTLANGSSGLLGFGAQHALQYSTLNLSDRSQLDAFRVSSANGADVHFMKRCGNFMYVCKPQN